jgi:glutamate dehydrogenase
MDAWKNKAAQIEKICDFARSEFSDEDTQDLCRFITAFYEPALPEELTDTSVDALTKAVASMWRLSSVRASGRPKIKIFNPKSHRQGWQSKNTVIQIINDDMPFLVDSITGGLTVSLRLDIHVLHHPIVYVERDAKGRRKATVGTADNGRRKGVGARRESHIYIEIDSQKGARERGKVQKLLRQILKDIRITVKDWPAMLKEIDEAIEAMTEFQAPVDDEHNQEAREFLRWLKEDHFTLIGYREYRSNDSLKTAEFKAVRNSGLGILKNPTVQVLRGPKGLTAISPEISDLLNQPDPIIITKANVRTRVHRPVHLDYIGVKMFDSKGSIVGERRFVGLFTSLSYSRLVEEVPFLRRKISRIQDRARFERRSHAGKALAHILQRYPRDELFQIGENQLLDISQGILGLLERPRVRAFLRRDKYERYVSAMVYVPRDKYNSLLRRKIEKVLCDSLNGEISVYYAELAEALLARWHIVVRTRPGEVPPIDDATIEARVVEAAKDWLEHLHEKLNLQFGDGEGNRLFEIYRDMFSPAFREAFVPHQAVHDIRRLEQLEGPDDIAYDIYRLVTDSPDALRLKLYSLTTVVPLSDCLPMLEHLGLKVIAENSYGLQNHRGGCVHDFYLKNAFPGEIDLEISKPLLEDLLVQVTKGRIEDDGLNALAIQAQIPCQEIVILRAYVKYLRQIGLPFSQDYIEGCVVKNPDTARNLVQIFKTKFDPDRGSKNKRSRKLDSLAAKVRTDLDRVSSLDEDRTLRACLKAILATTRTNCYKRQYKRPAANMQPLGLALKIKTGSLEMAPKPRPFAEIFVYSTRYEGVHLRGGPVARGGIRWSDRHEDFRTEVLGLVKAQQVKNAVIVPVGAKGGFVPKHLPLFGDRDAFMAEGVACYKSFVASLLSVTDNIKNGRIVPPNKVERWDKADPYLVVAADKGTATFSDIANGVAEDNDFWLGDAFASGGSNGYDHKKMGITARGAWVSVERHFRELGINVSKDPITVIGIGDMSGDVFGNGMLQSRTLKLQAAFDHRNIFFDPNPDLEASFKERQRLFRRPRSSWDVYNRKLLSKGGRIYSRAAKSVQVTEELKAFLGVDAAELSPNEVIHHILKAEADFLWIGGIGTYIKARNESNAAVGDRGNDSVRINATELRVKVIGEGGNLGVTQRARIEFASRGGRLNTDFIDNSAGVDLSDKEVNIKILLQSAIQAGKLTLPERRKLLSRMTNEVASFVLEDNYLQTQAISIAEYMAVQERRQHLGLIRLLEREGRLDRDLENLPTDEDFSALALAEEGLSRPELSVLVSYAKMSLFDALMNTRLIDTPMLEAELEWGFPKLLRRRFPTELREHQLRKEIVATTLANEVINRGGLTFVFDVREEIGLPVEQIVSAFLIIRDSFGLNKIWSALDELDYSVDAALQTEMHVGLCNFLSRQTGWFLRNLPKPLNVPDLVARYSKGLIKLLASPERVLSPLALEAYAARRQDYESQGVPKALARKVAAIEAMSPACDIVNVAESLNRKAQDVAKAYFEVGHIVGFDWLRSTAAAVGPESHWDSLAINSAVDDLADQQRELTRIILSGAKVTGGPVMVSRWAKAEAGTVYRTNRLLDEIRSSGAVTVAKLSFAARQFRSILPLA